MIETLKTNSFFNDTNKFKLPSVNLQFTSEDSNNKSNILNYDEFLRLNFYKSKIDELDDTNDWDEAKKISNF